MFEQETRVGSGTLIVAVIVALLLGTAVIVLGVRVFGTPGERAQAAAIASQGEAYSYQIRTQAETAAAAERAALREAARESAHERALESIPAILVTGGVALAAIVIAFATWNLKIPAARRPEWGELPPYYLEQIRAEQRELWHALAQSSRRQIASHYVTLDNRDEEA